MRWVLLTLIALLAGSCVPVFTEGLPVSKHPKVDKELLGTWYIKAKSKVSQSTVTGKKNGWIEIKNIDDIRNDVNEPNYPLMPTYTTEINHEKFLSIPMYTIVPNGKPSDSNNYYTIVNYKVEKSNLRLKIFMLNKVEKLIETGVLKGKIEKQASFLVFDSVFVTSSGREVADAIKRLGVDAFTDPNCVLVFTREIPK
jgi:hypothetical protein